MFNHLLIPLDGSSLAERVLPHAVSLAQTFEASVTLLRVIEEPQTDGRVEPVDPLDWYMFKAEGEAYLDALVVPLQEAGLQTKRILLEGQPAHRIVEFVHSHNVDLITLSSHGKKGLSAWNVSSVVHKIIWRSRVSTMIVRAYQPMDAHSKDLQYQRLLVPLDGSQRAECALPVANALARLHDSELLLAHVVCRPEMPRRVPLTQEELELLKRIEDRNQQEAARYLEQLQSSMAGNVQIRLLISEGAAMSLHELVEREKADLVVLSGHGYSGKTKWPYGGVTNSFIQYGTTPLLIVQDLPPEEVEPTEAEVAAREIKGH
jgi:nucleotide-binding universal stress UspA family protein